MGGGWRRMHPVALVKALIESAKAAVTLTLTMLAIAIPNRDDWRVTTAVWIGVAGVVAWMLVSPVVVWLTRAYMLDDHGITLRSGVLNRKRVTIAYDRIHAVSSSAPIYMRPFDVVMLTVTAAGSESSMMLTAVPVSLQMELEARRQRAGAAVVGVAGVGTVAGTVAGAVVAGGAAAVDGAVAGGVSSGGGSVGGALSGGGAVGNVMSGAAAGGVAAADGAVTGCAAGGAEAAGGALSGGGAIGGKAADGAPGGEMVPGVAASGAAAPGIGLPGAVASGVAVPGLRVPDVGTAAVQTSVVGATGVASTHHGTADDAVPGVASTDREAAAAEMSGDGSASAGPASSGPAIGMSASVTSAAAMPTAVTPVTSGAGERGVGGLSGAGAADAAAGRPIDGVLVFRASVKDIMLFAATDLGMFAAVFVVLGVVEQARDIVPRGLVDSVERSVVQAVTASVAVLVGVVLAVVLVMFVVSAVSALLRFYGFEVWRRGGDLIVVRGALTRRVTTIAVDRIQTVTIRRSLVRRLFRLGSVRLGLGASTVADGEDADMNGADILPVISDARVVDALRRMLPEWDIRAHQVRRTGRGLLRYYVLMPVLVGVAMVVAVVIGTVAAGGGALLWWMLAPVAVSGFWTLCRWLKYRSEGYAAVGARRIMVTGASVLSLFTVFTDRSRVQSVERSTTIWREARGVYGIRMPLFVTNSVDELRFTALRGADADALESWADPGGMSDAGRSDGLDGR